MPSRLIRILPFALMSVLLLASAASTFAQTKNSHSYSEAEPNCDSPHDGSLAIDATRNGYAVLSLEVCVAAERELDLRQKLPAALGCEPGQYGFSVYKNDELAGL